MKLEIQKQDLLNLIGKTQNVVDKKNPMSILVNILLDAKDNKLKVMATDLEISLTDEVNAKVTQAGKVAVSAKNLYDIGKELSDGPISLSKRENHWLEIRQGKYFSKIVGVSADEYPVFPSIESNHFFRVDSKTLGEMIDKTVFSTSTDETRYHLSGVYFETHPQQGFRMVATDGHRLSLICRPDSYQKLNVTSGVIIPRKGLNEIKKIIEGVEKSVEMSIEGPQLIIKCGSAVLMIRLIEGRYPSYQQFIPQKLNLNLLLDKENFSSSLKRVSLLANAKSKAVLINLSKGKMEISSNNPDLGDAKEEIEVDYSGSDLKLAYNARYVQEVLNNITDEKIEFQINDGISPSLIRPHKDSSYTCIVMPMRV